MNEKFSSTINKLAIDMQQPTYSWNDKETGKQVTANRYQVELANGHQLIFLSVGAFKFKEGDVLDYTTKDFKFGKLAKKENTQKFNTITYNKSNVKNMESTQTYIIRQNSASNACNFYAQSLNTTPEEIINLARQLENYVLNG
jgi:hypothetical protein